MRMFEIRSQTENHGTMDQSLNKKKRILHYIYIYALSNALIISARIYKASVYKHL